MGGQQKDFISDIVFFQHQDGMRLKVRRHFLQCSIYLCGPDRAGKTGFGSGYEKTDKSWEALSFDVRQGQKEQREIYDRPCSFDSSHFISGSGLKLRKKSFGF